MSTETLEKKTRTPRNADSILHGTLKLELHERVDLVRELKKSIEEEVKSHQEIAKKAAEISQGL